MARMALRIASIVVLAPKKAAFTIGNLFKDSHWLSPQTGLSEELTVLQEWDPLQVGSLLLLAGVLLYERTVYPFALGVGY